MKDLNGIDGWLAFYYATIGILLSVMLAVVPVYIWRTFPDLGSNMFIGMLILYVWLAANLIGVFLMHKRRTSVTRTYQIWYNLIVAVIALWRTIQTDYADTADFALRVTFTHGVWGIYWIVSKRVKTTFPNPKEVMSD